MLLLQIIYYRADLFFTCIFENWFLPYRKFPSLIAVSIYKLDILNIVGKVCARPRAEKRMHSEYIKEVFDFAQTNDDVYRLFASARASVFFVCVCLFRL